MNLIQRLGFWLAGGEINKDLNALHPELEHIINVSTGGSGADSGPKNWAASVATYKSHVWVHKAVRLIADNLAPLPVLVADSDGAVIEGHPLSELLRQVNPQQSSADLWRQYFTDHMLGGESGIEIRPTSNGDLAEIWSRQPQQITVFAEDTVDGRRYFKVAGYSITLKQSDGKDEVFKVPPEFFIHSKFYNPADQWRGLSPLESGSMSIRIDVQAQAWSESFFRNNARPDFVIVSDGMTPSEREAYALQFESKFKGRGQSHKGVVVEKGVTDVKPIGWSAPDTEWMEQRKMARDEIGGLFGVPDELMGYGKDTYENMANAREMFWTLTLMPLIGHRDRVLTEHFQAIGMLDKTHKFITDTSQVTELQEDFTEKLQQAQLLRGLGYGTNEINGRLSLGMQDIIEIESDSIDGNEFGQDEIDRSLDQIFAYHIEQGVVDIDEVRESLGFPARNDPDAARLREVNKLLATVKAAVDARIPLEQALQLAGLVLDLPPAPPDNGSGSETVEDNILPFVRKDVEVAQMGSNEHKDILSKSHGRQDEVEGDVSSVIEDELDRQLDDALASVDSAGNVDFDPDVEALLWVAALDTIVTDFFDVVGQAELDAIAEGLVFNVSDEAVRAAISDILGNMAGASNDTTFVGLQAALDAALDNGTPLQDAIIDYFSGRSTDAEIERITRTLLTAIDTRATIEGAIQSELNVRQVWITQLDGAVRDAHGGAHGQIKRLGEAFSVGGELLDHPGDPRGSPSNIINCRCAIQIISLEN